MQLDYSDPDFWRALYVGHWETKTPTVFVKPFKSPLFTEDDIFRAVRRSVYDPRVRKVFKKGHTHNAMSVFEGGAEIASFAEWERHCREKFGQENVGVMLSDMYSLDQGLCASVGRFLIDSSENLGVQIAETIVDMFFGAYLDSFFGLHKDNQEILNYVVRGQKVIYAWPFEYFQKLVPEVTEKERHLVFSLHLDYRPHLAHAVRLEANAGDLLYWPSDWWHIAVCEDGSFSTMLSVGLVLNRGTAAAPSAPALVPVSGLSNPIPSLPQFGRFEKDRLAYWAKMSRFGFQRGFCTREGFPDSVSEADEQGWQRQWHCPFIWCPIEDEIWLVAGGYTARIPNLPSLVKIFESLSATGECRAESWAKNFDRSISASYWDLSGEERVTEITPTCVERWVLGWLTEIGVARPNALDLNIKDTRPMPHEIQEPL